MVQQVWTTRAFFVDRRMAHGVRSGSAGGACQPGGGALCHTSYRPRTVRAAPPPPGRVISPPQKTGGQSGFSHLNGQWARHELRRWPPACARGAPAQARLRSMAYIKAFAPRAARA